MNTNNYKEFLYIHYIKTENDTCNKEYSFKIIDSIEMNFKSYIPTLLKDWQIHIYNEVLLPNHSGFSYSNKKIIITTKALNSYSWDYLLSKAIAIIFMHKIKFKKNNFIKNKWKDLRQSYNSMNPESTFIEDFINLFGTELAQDKKYTNLDPDKLNGLRSLYYIWYSVLNSIKWYNIILYRVFVSIPKVNYLGYIYIVYDIKDKKVSWNKITSQGFWTYSTLTDQWSLNFRFM